MNWEHLRAFLWLRSRIRANQSKRAGSLTNVLHSILWAIEGIIAIVAFCGTAAIGMYLLSTWTPTRLMYAWDLLIFGFLVFWVAFLSAELQRSELLPLEKFLQYPISVSSLFLINYVASVASERLTMFFYLPAMLGLSVGLVIARGVGMLWMFPLVASFILMVTAVTYQFRGWLAILMMNKRHRRTVVTVVTVATMLLFQLPYLSSRVFGTRRHPTSVASMSNEQRVRFAALANEYVPLGWLAYGAKSSAEGKSMPALLGFAGMTLIGILSLRRSYRTTVQLYTGNYGSGRTRSAPVGTVVERSVAMPSATSVSPKAVSKGSLLEMKLPWFSEQATAVALATFRSLTRAPEAKMVLISPVIMLLFFGGAAVRWSSNPSEFTRPLMATGALTMILFTMSQLAINQFAFDRSGFRNFVLSSASRRDILLGKNLALAPITLGLAAIAVTLLQWFYPMRMDHFIGVLLQMMTMFLLNCLLSNFMSIINPTAVAAGSLRPAVKPSGKTILFGLVMMMTFPLALAPSMIPLGMEYFFHWMGWYTAIPVFLLLSVVETAGVAFLYSWVLEHEGRFLQSRELRILEVVTARVGED